MKTSWLSREALSLGLFAKLAIAYSALSALTLMGNPTLARWSELAPTVQALAAGMGAVGVLCSVMVYVATQRAQWSAGPSGIKFFGTAILLGSAAVFAVAQLTRAEPVFNRATEGLLWLLLLSTTIKLLYEGRGLLHTRDRRQSVHKRMAQVMLGDLARPTALRFVAGGVGGILFPITFLYAPINPVLTPGLSLAMLLLALLGEFAERYLFFRAAPASRMPGGLR
jgi:DMSO reductase anchor subunit